MFLYSNSIVIFYNLSIARNKIDPMRNLLDDTMFLVIDKYNFSEWLQSEMESRNLSQSELARRAGLNRAVVNKIVNQISMPTPETIEALARGLKLPSEQVFRAAGLLPPVPPKRAQVDELDHLANLLGDDDLQEVIDYAKMRLRKREEEEEKKIYKQKSSRSIRPARSALKR